VSSGQTITYTIQSGDTLFAIAIQFNLTLDQLLALNNLTRDTVLQVGQVLIVSGAAGSVTSTPQASPTATPKATPPPATSGAAITYTVQSGDTLFAIAAQFNLTLDQLLALNNLTRDTVLQVGQVLIVGAAAGTATPTIQPTATAQITVTPAVTSTTPAAATPTLAITSPSAAPSGLCLLAFDDVNGNARREAGEALVADVQFDMKRDNGEPVSRYTTNGTDEPHCVKDLPAGKYAVDATLPAGREATAEVHWSIGLLAGDTFNVEFASRAAATPTPPATSTPEATAAAESGQSGDVPIGAIAGGLLIVAAVALLFFGLRARRR
jgi:LysM repeat protein